MIMIKLKKDKSEKETTGKGNSEKEHLKKDNSETEELEKDNSEKETTETIEIMNNKKRTEKGQFRK